MASNIPIAAVVCIVVAIVATCYSVDISAGGSINLIALGTVDGKTFFADNTMKRNWTAAKTFCSGMGMRLGTITSKAQWDLLISAYNPTEFNHGHWTAARDSQERRQFTWDGLNSQPSDTFGNWSNVQAIEIQTCACLNPHPVMKTMYYYTCDMDLYVLCETLS